MNEEDKKYKSKMKETGGSFAEKVNEVEEKTKKIKKIIKIIGIKGALISILIVLITSFLGVVFFAASLNYIDWNTKVKATSAKENAVRNDALDKGVLQLDEENGSYKISYNEKTGKEAIEEILEDNNMNFGDFTYDEIECLYKCLKAEWATTYPNLGGDVDNKDIDRDNVQGVITVKRGKSGGDREEIIDLEYMPYENFKNEVSSNNEEVLKKFSMKDGNIIVANWSSNEIRYEISGNMPEDMKNSYINTGEIKNITEATINYRDMIGIHTVPFEFLLSLLINTEDVDFVSDLADLAFNSKIEITVYENLNKITSIEKEEIEERTTYQKWVDYTKEIECVRETRTVKNKEEGNKGGFSSFLNDIISVLSDITNTETTYSEEKISEEEVSPTTPETINYAVRTTRITKNNSYVVGLTNVDSWIAKVENECVYTLPPLPQHIENLPLSNFDETEEKEVENIETNDSDVKAYMELKGPKQEEKYSNGRRTKSTYTYRYVANNAKRKGTLIRTTNVTENSTQTEKYTYQSSNNKTGEIGNNFEEVYDKHSKAQAQLDCVSSWLFELLEDTESTVDYVSIMKYLLYKCTGNNYGVTELEDIKELFEEKSFNVIYAKNGYDQTVTYGGKEITYSANFASETKPPEQLGIRYTTINNGETTNYDACRVCNEYPAGTIPTTAIGLSLEDFPKVVAKWTGGSFVEYGDWVYINGWGYALVADCGGFTGKDSDYYHLDCFVGQKGDVLDDGKGDYSALKRPCINANEVYKRQPGNRKDENIYVIKHADAQKYIEEHYKSTSGDVTEMLNFGSKAVGKNLAGSKNVGVISSNYSYFNGAWCSVYAYSLYEHAGFITHEEANKLKGSLELTYAGYWQLMDNSKHYNGYLANGKEVGDVNYLPKPGDLILYKFGNVEYASHVGVVYEVNGKKMKTIEGNTDGGLCKFKERDYCKPGKKYKWGEILGYFSLESFLASKE